jgi:hypothetical protein
MRLTSFTPFILPAGSVRLVGHAQIGGKQNEQATGVHSARVLGKRAAQLVSSDGLSTQVNAWG